MTGFVSGGLLTNPNSRAAAGNSGALEKFILPKGSENPLGRTRAYRSGLRMLSEQLERHNAGPTNFLSHDHRLAVGPKLIPARRPRPPGGPVRSEGTSRVFALERPYSQPRSGE
jgi:hypothetical protein